MPTLLIIGNKEGEFVIDPLTGDKIPFGPRWASPEEMQRRHLERTVQTYTTGSSKLYWADQRAEREGRR